MVQVPKLRLSECETPFDGLLHMRRVHSEITFNSPNTKYGARPHKSWQVGGSEGVYHKASWRKGGPTTRAVSEFTCRVKGATRQPSVSALARTFGAEPLTTP